MHTRATQTNTPTPTGAVLKRSLLLTAKFVSACCPLLIGLLFAACCTLQWLLFAPTPHQTERYYAAGAVQHQESAPPNWQPTPLGNGSVNNRSYDPAAEQLHTVGLLTS